AVDVAVESSIATVLAPQPFVYFTPQPLTILDVSPATVIPCVPTEVTLTGESFVTGVTVFFETDFGDFEGTVTFVSTDGTTLTVLTPEVTGTDVDVTVRVDRGSASGELSGAFAFAEDFVRGDVNGDGVVDALDFDFMSAAFSGGPLPAIADSADMNDDGFVLINDLVLLRDFVNGVLATIPAPFPEPGPDPTADGLATGCDPAP
ncbi:MAG: dockerin type I domain-containing protein, partial [Planctomycetota bacterium]